MADTGDDERHRERGQPSVRNLPSSDVRRLQLVSGKGCKVFNEKETAFIDFVSSDVPLGHVHEAVVKAHTESIYKLSGSVGLLHPNTVELARRLVALMPSSLTACFIVNSHSEANDLALNLAFCATGSEEVICFDRADHGKTLACLRLCRDRASAFEKGTGNGRFGFGNHGGITVVPTPDTFRGKYRNADHDLEDVGWMYSSDVQEACATLLKDGRKVGPFICEAVSHVGGHFTLPPKFLRQVYKTVKSHGGVCIADETHCGLGRLGTRMWGFQTSDLEDDDENGSDSENGNLSPPVLPDIVTVGKSLGNGHPIAAVLTTKEIAKKFTTFVSYYNYLGDPTSCAVGLAVLDQLKDDTLLENVRVMGDYLMKNIKSAVKCTKYVGKVRGAGLSIGIDFVKHGGKSQIESNPAAAQAVRQKLFERQIVVSVCGPQRNVVGITPPYKITKDVADLFISKLKESLNELNREGIPRVINQSASSDPMKSGAKRSDLKRRLTAGSKDSKDSDGPEVKQMRLEPIN